MKQEIITGDRYLEIMWPLNDMFRARLHEIRVLPYSSAFEGEADAAVASLADNPSGAWKNISTGAWRVLLERHAQMIEVATANMIAGNPLITLPPGPGLTDDELRVGLALLLLLQMKLPFPLRELSNYEFHATPPVKPH